MEQLYNKTYYQLITDIEFVRKRIDEQYSYLLNLHKRYGKAIIDSTRYNELRDSAVDRLLFFQLQQNKLYGNTTK